MAKASSRKPAPTAKKIVTPAEDVGKIPFKAEEIGGELVSLLSEGLYSNPLDALREYIQNSIDARAKRVLLKLTGRSLFIRDNGLGMTKEKLVAARRFAVSEKDIASNIGFRGIGIYSAFHLCDKMRIRTKTSGEFVLHTADYDFAAMRKVLGAERGSAKSKRTPLVDLLSDYVRFTDEEHANEDSFTTVELLNISGIYYGMLASRDNVEQYILDTIPVNFPPDYKYGDEINARIRGHWDEYKPIAVILQYAGSPDHPVVKRMPPHVERPAYVDVKDAGGKVTALIWGCRNSVAEMIGANPSEREFQDLQGFAYKVKGMTVGSRRDSYSAFSQGSLYNWWTGEIYVLNDKVIPNAGRDGFEYNAAGRDMQIAVNAALRNEIEPISAAFHVVRRQKLNLERAQATYGRLAELAVTGILTPIQMGEAALALKDAETVAKKLNPYEKHSDAAEVRSSAFVLRDKIKKLIHKAEERRPDDDDDAKPPKRRKKAATTSAPLSPTEEDEDAVAAPIQSLRELLAAVGGEDESIAASVLAMLLDVLEEVLGTSAPEYRAVIDALQARLDDEGMI